MVIVRIVDLCGLSYILTFKKADGLNQHLAHQGSIIVTELQPVIHIHLYICTEYAVSGR